MRIVKFTISTVLIMTSLLGCSVGPDYRPTPMDMPPDWSFTPSQEKNAPDRTVVDWWNTLNDPLLSEYVNKAVESNHDYQIARHQVRKVRAQRAIAAAGRYPQVDIGGEASTFRISENGVGAAPALGRSGLADFDGDLFELGVDALWEIDIFGRTRRLVESADARVEASIESRRMVLLSIIGEIVINYAELRGAQQRLAIVNKNIALQAQTLQFVTDQLESGIGDELPVTQARGQLETTMSARHPLSATVRASAYRLAVLTGQHPSRVLEKLLSTGSMPVPSAVVPLGLPSDLLLRRPDIRRSERHLAAATADVGVATADLFPRFDLLGSFGFESGETGNLLDWDSRTYRIGPSFRLPVFQGGRIRANIDAFEADAKIALTRYEQTILKALEDVEASIVRYFEKRNETHRLAEAVAANAKSVELSQYLYKNGLTDFLTVLDAQRRLLTVEDRLSVGETQMVKRLVSLYKALGGGWEAFETAKVRLEPL